MNRIRIIRSGLCSTVQDLGREQFRHLGVPSGGGMDRMSHELANRLVGNSADAATIEMTLTGDDMQFDEDTLIAITGADMGPVIISDGELLHKVAQHRPSLIAAGSVIRFQAARRGCRCYVAISGGVDVPVVMGSRATLLRAGFGGHCGRAIVAGDELPVGVPTDAGLEIHRRLSASSLTSVIQPRWFVCPMDLPNSDVATLRIIAGSQTSLLNSSSHERLLQSGFRVSSQSDRMGYRLTDQPLSLNRCDDLLSEGVVAGTLQLPPDGNPILLMADCAPTGGYPGIGHVISADMGNAAQLRPGQFVKFSMVSLDEAQPLFMQQRRTLQNALTMAALQVWR
jgi:antagonist of KipI